MAVTVCVAKLTSTACDMSDGHRDALQPGDPDLRSVVRVLHRHHGHGRARHPIHHLLLRSRQRDVSSSRLLPRFLCKLCKALICHWPEA